LLWGIPVVLKLYRFQDETKNIQYGNQKTDPKNRNLSSWVIYPYNISFLEAIIRKLVSTPDDYLKSSYI
jgi:hypothetical protein